MRTWRKFAVPFSAKTVQYGQPWQPEGSNQRITTKLTSKISNFAENVLGVAFGVGEGGKYAFLSSKKKLKGSRVIEMAGGTMRARVPGIAAGAAMAQGPSDGRGSLQRQGFPPARPSLPDYIRCLVEMFTSLNGCVCRGRKKTHHGKKQKNCWRKKNVKKKWTILPSPFPQS